MTGVAFPSNDFTQMIEAVSRRNASGMAGLPGPATGEAQPTVRSRDLGRVVEVNDAAAPDAPLSAQEMFDLDQAARAAGVRDERLGNAGPAISDVDASQDQYGSLEEAMAAGSSVRQPLAPPAGVPILGPRVMVTATRVQSTPPRLPDFKNVQGIDLISGVVFVDDMEFKMHSVHLSELRKYAVETARDEIMKRLSEAVDLFTESTNDGSVADEVVLEVQDGKTQV